jgi:hypothetical protein
MSPEVRRKIEERMKAYGCDWWTACGFFGRRGGLVAGRRRSSKASSISQENRKQEAMGIR